VNHYVWFFVVFFFWQDEISIASKDKYKEVPSKYEGNPSGKSKVSYNHFYLTSTMQVDTLGHWKWAETQSKGILVCTKAFAMEGRESLIRRLAREEVWKAEGRRVGVEVEG
jgi:hypothetical protein